MVGGSDTLVQGNEPRAAVSWSTLDGRARRRVVGFGLSALTVAAALFWLFGSARPEPVALPAFPPYDRAPGRLPIPAPQPVDISRQILGSTLPWTGAAAAEPVARAAAGLVVGRWCRTPSAAAVQLDETDDWQRVTVTVRPLSGSPFEFLLRWDGTAALGAYRSFGGPAPEACG